MSSEVAVTPISADLQEKVLLGGDLSRLSPTERLSYYKSVCESLGLNPLTRPFDYIVLNGKLTLYARKDATEQLRELKTVSITKLEREVVEGVYVVTAHALDKQGRTDTSIGAVPIANLQGEARANAMMKAETKAKRRVTLSICGLGMLDETEVDSIPDAKRPTVMDHKREAAQKIAELKEDSLINRPYLPQQTSGSSASTLTGQAEADGTTVKSEAPFHAPEDGGDQLPSTAEMQPQQVPDAPAFIWRLGKHKGESIATIPDDYLDWFAQNGKMEDHRDAALNELDRRRGQGAL